MTDLALPTARDEEWRYADFTALETLAPEAFGVWKEVELAPGETRLRDAASRLLSRSSG